jgi:hypothetical protein
MVLRVAAPPPPAWDTLLPGEVRRLSAELATIDAYLDDDRFITPWQPHFPRAGSVARRSRSKPCCACCT